MRGHLRVKELFFLHSPLPVAQVPSWVIFFPLSLFLKFFFFCPAQLHGGFLALMEVGSLLTMFSRYSVLIPLVHVFLVCL